MLFQILGGLALLFAGGEFLVRGAASLAGRLGLSPLLIGIVVVGFGTSTPELITSVQAAIRDAPGIAIGNVVGSNISNVLLILGFVAVLAPVPVVRKRFVRDAIFLVASAVALVGVALSGAIGALVGALFLAALGVYLVAAYMTEPRTLHRAEDYPHAGIAMAVVTLGLGLAGTVFGAQLLVDGAVLLGRTYSVPESVIGVTIVAVGTSLPELAAALVAVARRHGAIAVGNVIGSNIFNTFGILGVTGLIRETRFPPEIVGFDIWMMLGATLVTVLFAATGERISRAEGAILVVGYVAFVSYLAATNL